MKFNVKKIAVASALVFLSLITSSADAVTVNVGGTNYTVTLSPSAVDARSYSTTLQAQVMFGNPFLASQLAAQVGC